LWIHGLKWLAKGVEFWPEQKLKIDEASSGLIENEQKGIK